MAGQANPTGLEAPRFKGPVLEEMARWVQGGDCVVLHGEKLVPTVFHRCFTMDFKTPETIEPLSARRVIWVDVSLLEVPSFQWASLMSQAGCKSCVCTLQQQVLQKTAMMAIYYLRPGGGRSVHQPPQQVETVKRKDDSLWNCLSRLGHLFP